MWKSCRFLYSISAWRAFIKKPNNKHLYALLSISKFTIESSEHFLGSCNNMNIEHHSCTHSQNISTFTFVQIQAITWPNKFFFFQSPSSCIRREYLIWNCTVCVFSIPVSNWWCQAYQIVPLNIIPLDLINYSWYKTQPNLTEPHYYLLSGSWMNEEIVKYKEIDGEREIEGEKKSNNMQIECK